MTTLQASHRDSFVLVGFFALVVLGMAASVGLRGSPVAGIALAGVAALIIAGGFAINRRPPQELRVTTDAIEHATASRSLGRISRADTGGLVRMERTIHQGRAHFWLSGGGTRMPLDGFDGDAVRAALAAHGWTVAQE